MIIVKYRKQANAWVVSIPRKLMARAHIHEWEKVVVSYDRELRAIVIRGTGVTEPPEPRPQKRRRRRPRPSEREVVIAPGEHEDVSL